MKKQHILDEIKRTAQANGGVPLGRSRFFKETGIKDSDWHGKHWVRWGDAVREAGFTPNQKNEAYEEEVLIEKFVGLTRELGRLPVSGDLRMKAHQAGDFPSHTVFGRIGSKKELIAKAADYCRKRTSFEDVLAFYETATATDEVASDDDEPDTEVMGFVYLLRSGRFYKIGRSNACGRRERELAIQLPEKATLVHQIQTDDPVGIEGYWHRRFESQRKNGEWFDLRASDVKAFRRRKFM